MGTQLILMLLLFHDEFVPSRFIFFLYFPHFKNYFLYSITTLVKLSFLKKMFLVF
ncbi:hypothetical protein C5S36_02015 [Candidatus Methanophagaceae archaeon]|nr:hypothetical protein C5S36_02015 [Methanophagales archaeon]